MLHKPEICKRTCWAGCRISSNARDPSSPQGGTHPRGHTQHSGGWGREGLHPALGGRRHSALRRTHAPRPRPPSRPPPYAALMERGHTQPSGPGADTPILWGGKIPSRHTSKAFTPWGKKTRGGGGGGGGAGGADVAWQPAHRSGRYSFCHVACRAELLVKSTQGMS